MSMQADVRRFVADAGIDLDPCLRHIDLASEVGELGKALLKAGDYGAAPVALNDEIELELGDCLFSLLALCGALGADAEAALARALAKYARRISCTGQVGSGGNPSQME